VNIFLPDNLYMKFQHFDPLHCYTFPHHNLKNK
jgi:hypothetical protein